MTQYSSALVYGAGAFNLALALFHLAFWRLFSWPQTLGTIGHVNRQILYILNLAVAALFTLLGVLFITHQAEVLRTDLGNTLLAGMAVFWLGRAVLQPAMFGLSKPLSALLFVVFLLGAALHGLAAW